MSKKIMKGNVKNSMFNILPENFFIPLSSPNKIVYWECICKLFSTMNYQLSFGVERDVLADELQYYFEQANAAEVMEEDFAQSLMYSKILQYFKILQGIY